MFQSIQDKIYNQNYNSTMNSQQSSQIQAGLDKDSQQNQIAGFVMKAFEILNVDEFQKIIYWAVNGAQFVIKDVTKFEQIVLPRYFRHNKMNSFVRQLNMYGFHKIKHNNFKSTFRHQNFRKDRIDLLPLIQRRPKFNEKYESQNVCEQPKINVQRQAKSIQSVVLIKKEQQPTMAHQKWANISQQFLLTTKMINFSLIKVSCNQLEISNLIPQQEDGEASIQNQLEKDNKREQTYFFDYQNPSCFFTSTFNI